MKRTSNPKSDEGVPKSDGSQRREALLRITAARAFKVPRVICMLYPYIFDITRYMYVCMYACMHAYAWICNIYIYCTGIVVVGSSCCTCNSYDYMFYHNTHIITT
jgi:hypothetical protein